MMKYDEIVDILRNSNDVNELIALKNVINKRIRALETPIIDINNLVVSDKVLLKDVRSFCQKNIKNVRVNSALFDYNTLAYACYFGIEDKELVDSVSPYDVRVYQTLGMDRKRITDYQGLGHYSLAIYEEMLKLYGLSLDVRLSDEEYNKLKRLHIEEERLKK